MKSRGLIRYDRSEDGYQPMRRHVRACERHLFQHTDPRDPDYEDDDEEREEE